LGVRRLNARPNKRRGGENRAGERVKRKLVEEWEMGGSQFVFDGRIWAFWSTVVKKLKCVQCLNFQRHVPGK